MKRYTIGLITLLLIVGCSKPIDSDTLIEDVVSGEVLKYHPETKELYSGKVFQNRMGGEKEFVGSYKDGKKDGKWTEWFENGKKEKEGTYKDGKYFLSNHWDKNGDIKVKDGNGLFISWHDNGQKKRGVTYKDGERDGLYTYWHWNKGRLYGKSSEGSYKDGKKDGKWTEFYYVKGKKKREETFKDGELNGKWTEWFDNGQKKREGTYKDGERDGLYRSWKFDGQLKSEWNYKDGKVISSKDY